jgi:hypothetical protein
MSADLRARVDQAELGLDACGSRREVQLIAISGGDDPGKFFPPSSCALRSVPAPDPQLTQNSWKPMTPPPVKVQGAANP